MGKLPKLKFDSNYGLVTIDGKRISSTTNINISCNAGDGYAKVELTFEAEVDVEGDVFILPHNFRRDETINKVIKKNKQSPNT